MSENEKPTTPTFHNPGRTQGEQLMYAIGVMDGNLDEANSLKVHVPEAMQSGIVKYIATITKARAALVDEYEKGLPQ